jgi:hypothetical protein
VPSEARILSIFSENYAVSVSQEVSESGSGGISDIQSISGINAVNPLVAFYDIHR